MIDMVLGTDMKQHVAIISRFQTSLQVKLHSRMITTAGCSSSASAESLAVKFEDPADRSMLLQVTLVCCWMCAALFDITFLSHMFTKKEKGPKQPRLYVTFWSGE